VEALRRGLESLRESDLSPRTPCPDSWTFACYIERDVDQETLETINAHIALCDRCYEEYLALADPEEVLADLKDEERRETAELRHQRSHDTEEHLPLGPDGHEILRMLRKVLWILRNKKLVICGPSNPEVQKLMLRLIQERVDVVIVEDYPRKESDRFTCFALMAGADALLVLGKECVLSAEDLKAVGQSMRHRLLIDWDSCYENPEIIGQAGFIYINRAGDVLTKHSSKEVTRIRPTRSSPV
jgi:hypothetical protein